MKEDYVEWFTTIGESIAHKIAKYLFLILGIVTLLYAFLFMQLLPLIFTASLIVLFVVFYLFGFVEYSFILVDEDMRIAVVYNKNRRKLKYQFSLNQVERMVPRIEDYSDPKYLCNPRDGEEQYTMVIHEQDERISLVIEAPEEFLDIMRRRRVLM